MLKTKDLAILSLIAVIICAVFLLDLYVPLGTAVWLIYIVPLAISFSASLPWIPLAVAIASCIAMLAGFYFDSHLAGIDPRIAAVNRTMASIVYLVLGNMGRLLIRNREALDRDAWIRQGEVEVSQAVQGDPGAAQLGERVLSTLAGRIGARAAVAYGSDAPGVSRLAAWGVDEASLGAGAGLRAGTLPAPWPRTGPCIWNWPPTRHWAGGRACRGAVPPMRLSFRWARGDRSTAFWNSASTARAAAGNGIAGPGGRADRPCAAVGQVSAAPAGVAGGNPPPGRGTAQPCRGTGRDQRGVGGAEPRPAGKPAAAGGAAGRTGTAEQSAGKPDPGTGGSARRPGQVAPPA
ncbi:hypothetical protein ACFSYD_20250 [Paracoccus aerius]